MYQEVLVAEALQQVLKVMILVIQVSGQSMMPDYLPVAILTPLPPQQVILVIQVVAKPTIICLHIWRFIYGNERHKNQINFYHRKRKFNEGKGGQPVAGRPLEIAMSKRIYRA